MTRTEVRSASEDRSAHASGYLRNLLLMRRVTLKRVPSRQHASTVHEAARG